MSDDAPVTLLWKPKCMRCGTPYTVKPNTFICGEGELFEPDLSPSCHCGTVFVLHAYQRMKRIFCGGYELGYHPMKWERAKVLKIKDPMKRRAELTRRGL